MTQPPLDQQQPGDGSSSQLPEGVPTAGSPQQGAPDQAAPPQFAPPQFAPPQFAPPQSAPQPGVPQYAWALPPQVFVPVETEPLEYHRLYRGAPKYAWWKPLVVLVLAASIYMVFNIGYSLLLIPALMAFDPTYLNDAVIGGISPVLDTQHPWSLVLSMGTIILMIPAVLLAMLCMGIRPLGRVWSVAGKIRWGLLGRTLLAALAGVVVMNGVGILVGELAARIANLPAAEAQPAFERADFSVTAAITSAILVLLLVPFQATAEEVVFRGLFLQVLGSWMRSPWLAVGLSSVVFASMHIYDIWGLLAVGLMGLVAAWITWKTGGLEAAIAIHILNNIAAFGFMTAGLSAETGQVESSGGGEALIGEAAGLAVFAWLTLRAFRKHGYGRERIDTVLRAVPAAPAYPVAPEQTGPTQ